jgi:hypothetical protein
VAEEGGRRRDASLDGDTLCAVWEMPFILWKLVSV